MLSPKMIKIVGNRPSFFEPLTLRLKKVVKVLN